MNKTKTKSSPIDETIIEQMPDKREKAIEKLSDEQIEKIAGLITAIEYSGLDEFMEYIRSPWKMLWPNFVAGVARGLGALLGAAIVIALIGWSLSTIIDLPLIGKKLEPYVQKVQNEFNQYVESTNYTAHFTKMEKTLDNIYIELAKKNGTPPAPVIPHNP